MTNMAYIYLNKFSRIKSLKILREHEEVKKSSKMKSCIFIKKNWNYYIYIYIHKSQCKLQIYKAEELTVSLTFLNITLPKNVVHQTFLLLELIMYYYRVYFSLSRIKKKLFYRKVRPVFFFVNTLNLGDKVISFM